jgi:hypothetical protein
MITDDSVILGLLAVLGCALGTYGAIMTGQPMRMVGG